MILSCITITLFMFLIGKKVRSSCTYWWVIYANSYGIVMVNSLMKVQSHQQPPSEQENEHQSPNQQQQYEHKQFGHEDIDYADY